MPNPPHKMRIHKQSTADWYTWIKFGHVTYVRLILKATFENTSPWMKHLITKVLTLECRLNAYIHILFATALRCFPPYAHCASIQKCIIEVTAVRNYIQRAVHQHAKLWCQSSCLYLLYMHSLACSYCAYRCTDTRVHMCSRHYSRVLVVPYNLSEMK
jgi:hypothetical protein